MSQPSKLLSYLGILLILAIGVIHLMDASDALSEAAYKGWLFYANAVAAAVAAFGIFTHKKWAWQLGVLIAAGSIIGYLLSRTVGLPLIPAEPDEWLEPLGIASLIAEGLFIVLYIKVFSSKK